MGYLISFTIGIIFGFAGGFLVYRNNSAKLKSVEKVVLTEKE